MFIKNYQKVSNNVCNYYDKSTNVIRVDIYKSENLFQQNKIILNITYEILSKP